tara:strand:+ start:215 stop:346 length:132 start_codon:yes stop_codon:yes gene_type:complete
MVVKPIDVIEVEELIKKAWKQVDQRIKEIKDLERNLAKLIKEN